MISNTQTWWWRHFQRTLQICIKSASYVPKEFSSLDLYRAGGWPRWLPEVPSNFTYNAFSDASHNPLSTSLVNVSVSIKRSTVTKLQSSCVLGEILPWWAEGQSRLVTAQVIDTMCFYASWQSNFSKFQKTSFHVATWAQQHGYGKLFWSPVEQRILHEVWTIQII